MRHIHKCLSIVIVYTTGGDHGIVNIQISGSGQMDDRLRRLSDFCCFRCVCRSTGFRRGGLQRGVFRAGRRCNRTGAGYKKDQYATGDQNAAGDGQLHKHPFVLSLSGLPFLLPLLSALFIFFCVQSHTVPPCFFISIPIVHYIPNFHKSFPCEISFTPPVFCGTIVCNRRCFYVS